MATEVTKIAESMMLVHLDFDIWTGKTRLEAADLKLGDGGEIPPQDVASLGTKTICSREHLKGFHRLKTQARRLMLDHGLPLMNGYAVPLSAIDEITKKLNEIELEFEQLRQQFLQNYHHAVDDWAENNPAYAGAIRSGTLPYSVVESRIGFDYQMFQIQPANSDNAVAERLGQKLGTLGDDLISEINTEANTFYNEKIRGKNAVGINTRLTLKNLRNKVDGLSFLNSAFAPLVGLLDETIAGYADHADGRHIKHPFLYQLTACVMVMCSRQHIEDYANGKTFVGSESLYVSPVTNGSWGTAANHLDDIPDFDDADDCSSDTNAETVSSTDQSQDLDLDSIPDFDDLPSEHDASEAQPSHDFDNVDDIPDYDDSMANYSDEDLDIDAFFNNVV